MRPLTALLVLLSLTVAGCKSSPERSDIELDPRPSLKGVALGDEVGDSVSEFGVRRMIPLVPFLFFLPIFPQISSPSCMENDEALGHPLNDLFAGLARTEGDIFRPHGWWMHLYAPRRDGSRHLEVLTTSFEPVIAGTEPTEIVAASARGVLHRTARKEVYVFESVAVDEKREWSRSLLVLGPADLVERRLLPSLTPTSVRPTLLVTDAGPRLGVSLQKEPDLYALPQFAGAPTPPSLVGVKPLSPAIWLVAYDTPAGRRWGALAWSPSALSGPRWRAHVSAPGPVLSELLRESAPARPDQSYLVVQEEDGKWRALLPFAAPLCPATATAQATAELAVAEAEQQARRTLDDVRAKKAAERARIAREQADAVSKFDSSMQSGDQPGARSALLSLAPRDAERWTRFVQKYGLDEPKWDSQVDAYAARRNGVAESVITSAKVNHPPTSPKEQSDWDYFWHGPADGSYSGGGSSSGGYQPSSYQAPASSRPTPRAWDGYREKQYNDTVRRYSR